jgi:hypothetical protein
MKAVTESMSGEDLFLGSQLAVFCCVLTWQREETKTLETLRRTLISLMKV